MAAWFAVIYGASEFIVIRRLVGFACSAISEVIYTNNEKKGSSSAALRSQVPFVASILCPSSALWLPVSAQPPALRPGASWWMGHRPGAGVWGMGLPKAPLPKETCPSGGAAKGEGDAEMSGEAQVLAARPA